MTTKILLKKSQEVGKVPLVGDLSHGELALNFADGKLYYKTSTGTIAYFKSGDISTSSVNSINDIGDVDIVNIQDDQTLIYNTSTAKFENVSINLKGGSANQILVKQSGSDYDYQWEDLNITVPVYTKLIDDVSTTSTLYLGEAQPESLENAAVWRIQKIVFDASGNVDSVRFAGTGTFTQIWDNRTSLTYL